jgi:ABC-type molybdate transport system substrate-binding protein
METIMQRAFPVVVSLAVIGIFGVPMTVSDGAVAKAAEIKLLSGRGFRPVLDALVPDFERTAGHKVTISDGTGQAVRDRIRDGEIVDVAILPWPLIDELLNQGQAAPGAVPVIKAKHLEPG